MSVDFFECTECGETVCECGSFERCDDCGNKFCDACFHKDEVKAGEGKCPVCSLKIVTDLDLVAFLLKRMKWTRKKGEAEYRKHVEASRKT